MFDDYLREYEGDDEFLFKGTDHHLGLQILKLDEQLGKKNSNRGRPKGEKNTVRRTEIKVSNKIVNQNRKTGHWSHEEKKRYHWFLEIHHHHFINKHLRRSDKIFKTMQTFLGTRQAEQCRSHHQKMQKKFKYFQRILIHLRNIYYGTLDPTAIAQDLTKNTIHFQSELLQSEYLQREHEEQRREENKIDDELSPLLQLHEDSKNIQNMFSDKYQNQMELRLKEEEM